MRSISPIERLPSPISDRYSPTPSPSLSPSPSPSPVFTMSMENPLFPLLDRVVSDRDALRLLNDHLSTQVTTLGNRLEGTTREKIQLEQDYTRLSEEKHNLEETGDSQKAHVHSLEIYISALLEQKRSLEAVLEFKSHSITSQNGVSSLREPDVKHAGDVIGVLKTKNQKLDGENAELRNTILALEENLANMKKLCQYTEEENRDLKEEVQDREQEIKVLEETPASDRYCKILETRNKFLQGELAVSKSDCTILEGRVLSLRTEMEDRPWKEIFLELEANYLVLVEEMNEEKALRIELEKDRSWKQYCDKLEAVNRNLKERLNDEKSWKKHSGDLEAEIHLLNQKMAGMVQNTKKVEGKTTTFEGVFKSMDNEKEKLRNEYLALGLTKEKTILFEELTNELSSLKNKVAQQEPLVQVALDIRFPFLEKT